MTRVFHFLPIFCLIVVSECLAHAAPDQEEWIVAVRRGGAIEFISPATLQTIGRIRFSFDRGSSGLNGVFAGSDRSTLYIEGPGPIPGSSDFRGCCSLFSIDLTNLRTRMVASIWGSRSREAVVVSEGSVYPATALTGTADIKGMGNDQAHLSPDRKVLFGVRNFGGPALDVYDLALRKIVRNLIPEGNESYSWATGIWGDERFYFYAATRDGAGRLWTVTPKSRRLGEGVVVHAFPGTGCTNTFLAGLATSGDRLFLYEMFGGKLDRRCQCGEQMMGGIWIVDPTTGRLLNQAAPELYFSQLISNRTGSELYGLTSGHADSQEPVTLVRIDARTGQILQSRLLDTDFWWITTARLSVVPTGDIQAVLTSP
jgi:hypothetical protein